MTRSANARLSTLNCPHGTTDFSFVKSQLSTNRMLRTFFILFILGTISVVVLAGFRGTHSALPPLQIFPDMKHQPRYDPQHESSFFADGSAARKPVAGTIPLGYTLPGSYLQAGAKNGTIQPTGFN